MKKIVSKFIQPAIAIIVMTLVVSAASAYTAPSGVFPAGNVPAPVNTGNIPQTKNANFSVNGNLSASSNVNGTNGFFSSLVNSAKARFGCFLLTCTNTTLTSPNIFEAGKYTAGDLGQGLVVTTDGLVTTKKSPLWINLVGNTGSTGRNGLALITSTDNQTGGDGAVIQTTADKFSFYNLQGTAKVGISAGSVDTNGLRVAAAGTAQPGKVLTAMNTAGDAIWADAGGATSVLYTNATSPAASLITYRRSQQGGGSTAQALCPQDSFAISGGGYCEYGMQISEPIIDTSNSNHGGSSGAGFFGSDPVAIGWHVDCLDQVNSSKLITDGGVGSRSGQATAEVICMKKNVAFVTQVSPGTSSTGGSGSGGTTSIATTWHFVPTAVPDGTAGQSCVAWLGGQANASLISSAISPKTFTAAASVIGSTTIGTIDQLPVTQTCAYLKTNGTCAFSATAPSTGDRPVKNCTSLGNTISTEIKY